MINYLTEFLLSYLLLVLAYWDNTKCFTENVSWNWMLYVFNEVVLRIQRSCWIDVKMFFDLLLWPKELVKKDIFSLVIWLNVLCVTQCPMDKLCCVLVVYCYTTVLLGIECWHSWCLMNAEAFCKITQHSCAYITKSEALCNRLSFA